MDVLNIGEYDIDVIVAVTPEEQSSGLMWQEWPPPVMVFPYSESDVRNFWMKNTPSPLDILFCNNNRIVSIEDGKPFSVNSVGPKEPVDLVIEMPKGMANQIKASIGQIVNIKYSINTVAKIYELKISKAK